MNQCVLSAKWMAGLPLGMAWQGQKAARGLLWALVMLGTSLPLPGPRVQGQEALPQATEARPNTFMGREIAVTMHYAGANWLTRESRQREEDCESLLKQLAVTPGRVVADVGCGNGFYTLPLASAVGAAGKVLAVDIQPEMLHLLELRAKQEKLVERIELIQGNETDPKLPDQKVDLVLLVDVYHEFSDPAAMMRAIRQSLAPGGEIALVEFRGEDPEVPIKPEHKMTKAQILKEFRAHELVLTREFNQLPWQHLMWFGKAGEAADGERRLQSDHSGQPTTEGSPAKK